MAIGRPIPPLHLSSDEREQLAGWTRRATIGQALSMRARIILGCAEDKTNTVTAQEMGLAKQTVGKWRARFISSRLDGLLDEPRPGGPRSITDADVERVVTLTLETTPADAQGSVKAPSAASGGPLPFSRIGPRPSSSRPIPCSSRRSGTSSACI